MRVREGVMGRWRDGERQESNCYGNAVMKACGSRLKNELVHRRRFATRADDRTAIFDYGESFYNRSRRPSSLGERSAPDCEFSLSNTKRTLLFHPSPTAAQAYRPRMSLMARMLFVSA